MCCATALPILVKIDLVQCTPICAPENIDILLREMDILKAEPHCRNEQNKRNFIAGGYCIDIILTHRYGWIYRRVCEGWCAGSLCWVRVLGNGLMLQEHSKTTHQDSGTAQGMTNGP